MLRATGLAVLLALGAGCPGDEESITQTVVRLDAHGCVGDRAARVRVTVLRDEGTTALDRVVELRGASATSFPLTLPIVPLGGDATRLFWVDATLLDDADAPLATVRVAGSHLPGRIGEVVACFTDRCAGVDCGPCTARTPDGGAGTCNTCRDGECVPAELTPVPLGSAPAPCSAAGPPGCGDGGVADAGVTDAGLTDAGGRDGGDPCDRDGDGFASTTCAGGVDCNDAAPSTYPGAPEPCADGADNDCDGFADCYDLEACRFDGTCNARRCSPTDARFRICGGECVNVYTDENHCGSCAMRCLNGRQCTTTGLDGQPRCYCAADADCAHGVNCNTEENRCGCNTASCGAGAHCEPGGAFPAYCAFDFD